MRIGVVEGERDLEQILALQQQNLVDRGDGFVTVRHTIEILRALHEQMPSVVARASTGDDVIAYALSMRKKTQALLPILAPMFARLEKLLSTKRWYVMGQVCVDEAWRGKGVFDALFAEHRARFSSSFDTLVTEIATRNPRSLKAHARVGFVEIDRYRDDNDEWSVVALDFQ
jgi:hypothetical protein